MSVWDIRIITAYHEINCHQQKAHFAGTVFAGGVAGVGEIDGHSALTKAYEMGRAV